MIMRGFAGEGEPLFSKKTEKNGENPRKQNGGRPNRIGPRFLTGGSDETRTRDLRRDRPAY